MPPASSRIDNPHVAVDRDCEVSARYLTETSVEGERLLIRLGREGVLLRMDPETAVRLIGVIASELKARDEYLEAQLRCKTIGEETECPMKP